MPAYFLDNRMEKYLHQWQDISIDVEIRKCWLAKSEKPKLMVMIGDAQHYVLDNICVGHAACYALVGFVEDPLELDSSTLIHSVTHPKH